MIGARSARRDEVTPSPPLSNIDELSRLRSGEQEAFEVLFARVQPRIIAITRRLVGSVDAAEDVAQDTWQAVIRGLATFKHECRLDTWVLQIAINRARSAYSLARRDRSRVSDDPDRDDRDDSEHLFTRIGAWAAPLEEWPSGASSPEEIATHRQALELVSAQLAALPELQRLVVVMCDVEGLDTTTAAEVLGVTPTNCRSLLHRGRGKVRAALAAALT